MTQVKTTPAGKRQKKTGRAPQSVFSFVLGFCLCYYCFPPAPFTSDTISKHSRSEHKIGDVIYKNSKLEKFFAENMGPLGLNWTIQGRSAHTCHIFVAENITNKDVFGEINSYSTSLDKHTDAVQKFEPINDLLKAIQKEEDNQDKICQRARLDPSKESFFPNEQLSYSSKQGYMEPLLPTMRHHKICVDIKKHITNIDYIVHDFEKMCKNLKPYSKRVFIDMGASLDFHEDDQPVVRLLSLYEKFGFVFDHIYAFEINPYDANDVYKKLLPEKYMGSYHWINVGVSDKKEDRLNPLYSILKTFDEDDFVVVKLDIDSPSIERNLANTLRENDDISRLVDQFYFEHHVFQREMHPYWLGTMRGTIEESFKLFHDLREKGIAAHYWV